MALASRNLIKAIALSGFPLAGPTLLLAFLQEGVPMLILRQHKGALCC